MSFYPQIGTGTITQFPVGRTRTWRVITSVLESGEQIVLPDTAAGQIAWGLSYVDLSDAETALVSGLFTACQGSFASFIFIDPLANLLGWSEDLSQPNWQTGLLSTASGIADPLGTERASTMSNGSTGTQQLTQTLGISGDYVACFSAYVRSNVAGSITIARDGTQTVAAVGPQWARVYFSGAGTAGAAQSTFSISIAAGQTVEVFGLQVETQPYPSLYRVTEDALGIYPETYFEDDELTVTATGVGLSSFPVKLISRV
ncbi:MAG: hypothetical protein ABSB15_05355 [Bryobacteraceae bacterium]|jgi:hypothetical protein